jgi:hypothetical protein
MEMRKGPYLVIYDQTNEERMSGLDFGTILAGNAGQDVVVWLWNKRDFRDTPTATDVRISVAAGNAGSEEIVENRYVSVRSDGVMDPDGVGIVDDAEVDFTPIGGGLLDPDSYHQVGDISTNCGRRLFFRLEIPEGHALKGIPMILVQFGFMAESVKWLYVAD